MFDLLKFLNKESSSKNVAKERLKLVLVHDRTNCSPEFLEAVKEDILNSIANHIDYDADNIDIKITQMEEGKDGRPALVASIPIKSMKRS